MNMITDDRTEHKTVIRYNEADGYFEVQHGDKCQRYPVRELALMRAHEIGRPVEFVAWDDIDVVWGQATLNSLDRMAAERGDSKPYRPANRTRAHLNRIEAVER